MKPIALFACAAVVFSAAQAQEQPLELLQALAFARANRPSLQAARLRLSSAKLSRRGLGAYPATRLFIGYQNNLALDGTEDDLAIAQSIDLFGRTAASKATGDAEILRAQAELQAVLADIQADVIDEFSEAAAAKALAQSAAHIQEIAQRLYDSIRTLVDEGKLPGVQLMRVGIELDRAKLANGQRSAELQASLQRLSGLVGMAMTVEAFAELSVDIIEPARLPGQRSDLLLLASEIRTAEAETRVAKLASAPELEIQVRRSPWQERDQQYGLRIQLGFPINDFGKSRAETAAVRTKAEAARKALADATRIAESELAAAKTNLAAAQEQIQRYQTIVQNARALVEKSRIGFTEKAITLVELLESTRALRETEEGLVESRLRLARAQSAYLKASGQLLEVPK